MEIVAQTCEALLKKADLPSLLESGIRMMLCNGNSDNACICLSTRCRLASCRSEGKLKNREAAGCHQQQSLSVAFYAVRREFPVPDKTELKI
nr:hypothetical protein [Chitinophaga varians]